MPYSDLLKGRYSQIHREYFITFCCYKCTPFFASAKLAQLFCTKITTNEQACGCQWLTWVLMPDHFHGLVLLHHSDLSACIRHLKGCTAAMVNRQLQRRGKVWQSGFYDHALREDEQRIHIARYIVANPLRKGIVSSVRLYPYWNSVYL